MASTNWARDSTLCRLGPSKPPPLVLLVAEEDDDDDDGVGGAVGKDGVGAGAAGTVGVEVGASCGGCSCSTSRHKRARHDHVQQTLRARLKISTEVHNNSA